jgi:hypothetical protein
MWCASAALDHPRSCGLWELSGAMLVPIRLPRRLRRRSSASSQMIGFPRRHVRKGVSSGS